MLFDQEESDFTWKDIMKFFYLLAMLLHNDVSDENEVHKEISSLLP